jgi:uncharacterized membrane protein
VLLMVGVNVTDCVVILPFHVYVEAPLATKFTFDVEHTVAEAGLLVIIGKLFVAIATVFEETQLAAFVPETVYVEFTDGVTTTVALLELVLQV